MVSVIASPAAWMGSISTEIASMRLDELLLPGTHDSGSYRLDDRLVPDQGLNPSIRRVVQVLRTLHAPFPYEFVKKWALAQSMDISGQLEHGIRFLDLRPVFDQNVWKTAHTLIGDDLDAIFGQIASFASKYPSEVIVVQLSNVIGGSLRDRHDLLASIERKLADCIYSRSSDGFVLTYQEMIQQNKRVVVAGSHLPISNHSGIWPASIFEGEYTNQDSLEQMFSRNAEKIRSYGGDGRLFQLYWTLTAQSIDIEKSLLIPIHHPSSLNELASIANLQFHYFSNSFKNRYRLGNILLMDFFEMTNLVSFAKEQNVQASVCFDERPYRSVDGCRSMNCSLAFPRHVCHFTCGLC